MHARARAPREKLDKWATWSGLAAFGGGDGEYNYKHNPPEPFQYECAGGKDLLACGGFGIEQTRSRLGLTVWARPKMVQRGFLSGGAPYLGNSALNQPVAERKKFY